VPSQINFLSQKTIDSTTSPDELLSILLSNRQISDPDSFFNPAYPNFDFNFQPLVELIKSSKNILIYGDYDVDGITATAILWQSLYKKGLNVTPFIPNRESDGYGFRSQSFLNFENQKDSKFDLIITVDNGIVAIDEFSKLLSVRPDIKIIVSDHHEPDSRFDQLKSLVSHVFHSTSTSGAGLSWFLAKQFNDDADLGLAALGAVADMMPLLGLNRSLVVHGLKQLKLNPSPGIRKLMDISRIKLDELSAYHLGFMLGPRINAVGRLSDPTDALRLLCSPNLQTASKYAKVLDEYNRDRQSLQADSLALAENITSDNLSSDKLIFVADKSYHPGIIGLIAGRLTEKYYLPAIAISQNGEVAKGSCRSIPELNIIEALRQFSDLFVDLGGHAGAAGFSIKDENIPILKQKLTEYINSKLNGQHLTPHLDVDAPMSLSAVSVQNYNEIQKLAPFGLANPEPLFYFPNIQIRQKRLVGATGDHLSLNLVDTTTPSVLDTLARRGGTCSAIAFKQGQLFDQIQPDQIVNLIASLSVNIWNNRSTPQLIIKEIIPTN